MPDSYSDFFPDLTLKGPLFTGFGTWSKGTPLTLMNVFGLQNSFGERKARRKIQKKCFFKKRFFDVSG